MYVTVRKVIYNSGEVMLQRLYWLAFMVPIWRDWKLLNNDLYYKDEEILKTVNKLKKLYAERKEIELWLKAEQKEIDDSKRYRKGVSESFKYRIKAGDYFYTRYPDLAPVDGAWRSIFTAEFLGSKKKAEGLRGEMNIPEHKSSGTTAYIPQDLAPFKIALNADGEFDSVVEFKEPQNQKSKSGSSRKKQSGETDREHQARLRRMDEAKNSGYDY